MFLVHCPAHGADVLLGVSRICGLVNVRGLIVVELECYDGERIRHLTGKRAHEASRRLPPDPAGPLIHAPAELPGRPSVDGYGGDHGDVLGRRTSPKSVRRRRAGGVKRSITRLASRLSRRAEDSLTRRRGEGYA